jgi:hypothetical protein
MWHARETGEVHTGFGGGTWEKKDRLKDLCLYVKIILKCIFNM